MEDGHRVEAAGGEAGAGCSGGGNCGGSPGAC